MNKKGAGRPRTPDPIKKAKGTFRKDRSKDTVEHTVLNNMPNPPDYLDKNGIDEWNSKATQLLSLGMLSGSDLGALAALCNEWQNYLKAEKDCATTDRYYAVKDKNGNVTYWGLHPAHTVAQQHLKAYITLCNEFGMTPASRIEKGQNTAQTAREKQTSILDFIKGGNVKKAV